MEDDKSPNTVKPSWSTGLIILAYLLFEYIGLSPLIRARIEAPKLTKYGMNTEAEVFDPGYETEFEYFIVHLYRLCYRFSAEAPEKGQQITFTDSQFVSGDTARRLTAGTHVTVIYLPSDPSVSRLAGADRDNTDLDDFLIYVLVIGPPIALGVWGVLSWLRKWIDSQNTMP